MHSRFSVLIVILLASLTSIVKADPLKIIIVTGDAGSERGYTEFLQHIYKGNVDVQIDADRYDEDLSATFPAKITMPMQNSGTDWPCPS